MANKKISELTAATTPLAGTEELAIVQDGTTKRVAASHIGSSDAAGQQTLFVPSVYSIATPHTSRASATTSLNRVYFTPFWVPRALSIDRIAIEVTAAAASSVVRVGIYSTTASSDWPDALVSGSEGTIDTSASTGVLALTVALTLQPGFYWVAAVAQGGTPTLRLISGAPYNLPDGGLGATIYNATVLNSVSGALPASAAAAGGGVTTAPVVLVRPT